MENVPESELFSAYLDGELTAEEQADVEKLLAASPVARQLLDELRALSTTLQSLPAHKLGEDLGETVLRRAEREMLREPAADLSSPQPAKTGWRPLARRFLTPRNFVWSGTAVAVAILLTINNPLEQEPEFDRLAMAPEAADEFAGEDSRSEKLAVGPSIRATSEVADEAAPMEEGDIAVDSLKARSVEAPSVEAPLVEAPLVEAKSDSLPKAAMSKAAPAPRRKSGKAPPAVEAFAGGSGAGGAGGSRAGGAGGGAMKKKAASANDFAPGLATKAGPQAMTARDNKPLNARKGMALKGGAVRPGQAAQGVLVVRCDISPKAARDQAFDRVLTSQQISLDQTAVETKNQFKQEQKQIEANLPADRRQTGGELDLIYAEATPGQIEGTLAALSAQPDTFLSVSVEPDPGVPSQQPLMRYGRGRSLVAASPAASRPAVRPSGPVVGKAKAAEPRSQPVNAAKQGDVRRGFAQRLQMPAQAPGQPMQARSSQAMQSAAPSKLAVESEAAADKPSKAEGRLAAEPPAVSADGQAGPAQFGMAQQKPDSERDNRQRIPHSQIANGPGADRADTYRVLFVLRIVGAQRPALTNQASESTKAKIVPSVDASRSKPAVKQ